MSYVLLLANRQHGGLIRLTPSLNTEEGVVLEKKIKGLLLKGGEMDSGQPKPSRRMSSTRGVCGEAQACLSGTIMGLPFSHPGWTRVPPTLGKWSARAGPLVLPMRISWSL